MGGFPAAGSKKNPPPCGEGFFFMAKDYCFNKKG